jgi:hypothetical protein
MQCPKCNYEQPVGKAECLCCGIIFAKYKSQPAYAQAPAPQAYASETLTMPRPSAAPQSYNFELARLGSRVLSINESFVSLKNKSMACRDIQWLKMGSLAVYINLIKTGTTYEIVFGGNQGKLKVDLVDALYGKRNGALFEEIVEAVWECVGSRIANDIIRYIGAANSYQIGQSVWELQGVRLPRSRFFGAADFVLVPWDELEVSYGNGTVWMKSVRDRKAKMSAQLRTVENACLIRPLYSMLIA